MRYVIRLLGVICCALGPWSAGAAAQAEWLRDFSCLESENADVRIRACSELIRRRPRQAKLYSARGYAYADKGDYDSAIADLSMVIRLKPRDPEGYVSRAVVYSLYKGDLDRAIADYTEAIKLDPKNDSHYKHRGDRYLTKGDYDRAIADYAEAIRLDPSSSNYKGRADAYKAKGDYDRAVADATRAIGFNADNPDIYHTRGEAYLALRQHDRAIEDFNKALSLDVTHLPSLASRGEAYEGKGDRAKAIEDFNRALALPAKTKSDKEYQSKAAQRLAALQSAPPAVVPPPVAAVVPATVAPPPSVSVGKRVALVIGNAAYRNVKALPNPMNDGRELAGALRAAGFTEVVEHYDLGVQQMRDVLKTFEEKATGADWAVVYYAGHGIEVDGRNYLIPVDAALKSASDVEDETLPLDRVLARVAVAKRLQLVILDACRDNPFVPRMAQAGGIARAVGTRGLGRIEPAHPNLYVAYSARHGEVALDGTGTNSPYARPW